MMDPYLLVEIAGMLIGFTYLYLEYKASFWLWPAGIVMSLFYIYIYYHGKFYADMGTYIYYLGANIYGLLLWRKQAKSQNGESEPLKITPVKRKYLLPSAGVFTAVFVLLYLVLRFFTDSPVPFGDSFTTALSVIAMWMMARKHPEHWILWTIVNATSTLLYVWKGLYPTAFLFLFYTVVSIMGYFKWKRLMINGS